MVGQIRLIDTIQRQITDHSFPRFVILVGPEGSEKNDVARYISEQLNALYVETADCKVDTVRDIILNAYKINDTTVYNLTDADNMSLQARNALLKVTEEPPNKAYFVMPLEDINNTLPTIKSRGTVFTLDPYTSDELRTYYTSKYGDDPTALKIVTELSDTPGDVDLIALYKPADLYKFVNKVFDNIATAGGSNVLKIAQSIKLKDVVEEGYDLKLFWKAFCLVCRNNERFSGISITSRYLAKLRNKSINRPMLFDSWIFDIREEWKDGSN